MWVQRSVRASAKSYAYMRECRSSWMCGKVHYLVHMMRHISRICIRNMLSPTHLCIHDCHNTRCTVRSDCVHALLDLPHTNARTRRSRRLHSRSMSETASYIWTSTYAYTAYFHIHIHSVCLIIFPSVTGLLSKIRIRYKTTRRHTWAHTCTLGRTMKTKGSTWI